MFVARSLRRVAGGVCVECDAIDLLPRGPHSPDTSRKHSLDAVKFNLP